MESMQFYCISKKLAKSSKIKIGAILHTTWKPVCIYKFGDTDLELRKLNLKYT